MKNLTVGDLRLAIEDLLDPTKPRFALLSATQMGAMYLSILKKKLTAILSLPESRDPKRHLTEELGQTDQTHDGYGGAFWEMTGAYLRAPDTPDELKKSLIAVRETFLKGGLAELIGTYADEASLAKGRLGKLDEHKALLQSIPVAGGKTLYDWVKSFLENGVKLDTLMGTRTYTEASQSDGSRANAGPLRGETIGVLSTMRAGLRDEQQENPSLPANLDALVFGYFDELQAKRYTPPTATTPPTPTPAKGAPGV